MSSYDEAVGKGRVKAIYLLIPEGATDILIALAAGCESIRISTAGADYLHRKEKSF